jgi:hypothetical protein
LIDERSLRAIFTIDKNTFTANETVKVTNTTTKSIFEKIHSIECEELPAMIPYANKITLYNYILHIKYIIELPEIVRTTLYNHILYINYITRVIELWLQWPSRFPDYIFSLLFKYQAGTNCLFMYI